MSALLPLMSEDLGKEIPGAVGPRLGEELVRGAVLDDLAIGHERDTVGGVTFLLGCFFGINLRAPLGAP